MAREADHAPGPLVSLSDDVPQVAFLHGVREVADLLGGREDNPLGIVVVAEGDQAVLVGLGGFQAGFRLVGGGPGAPDFRVTHAHVPCPISRSPAFC